MATHRRKIASALSISTLLKPTVRSAHSIRYASCLAGVTAAADAEPALFQINVTNRQACHLTDAQPMRQQPVDKSLN
jgi:hypothetical protein